MDNENYAIFDLEGYASQMREVAASNISDSYHNDNLDDYITIKQIINILNKECIGFDEKNRPVIDEAINEAIFEQVSIWIHNLGLARLAAKDLVECAWDNDTNEMVFWAKTTTDSNNHDKSKPKRNSGKNKKT